MRVDEQAQDAAKNGAILVLEPVAELRFAMVFLSEFLPEFRHFVNSTGDCVSQAVEPVVFFAAKRLVLLIGDITLVQFTVIHFINLGHFVLLGLVELLSSVVVDVV